MIYPDDESWGLASEADADREYALNVGRENQEHAWILSDRDVWYRNPFYQGPPQRHPEDDSEDYGHNPNWTFVPDNADELPF